MKGIPRYCGTEHEWKSYCFKTNKVYFYEISVVCEKFIIGWGWEIREKRLGIIFLGWDWGYDNDKGWGIQDKG